MKGCREYKQVRFSQRLAGTGMCVHTGKQTHTEENPLVSAAISFSPTQIDTVRPVCTIGRARIHWRDHRHPTNSLILTHTHTQAKLMTSVLQNRSGSPCSKQFSVQQASERKRGRTGRWERSGKKQRENWCFHPILKIMTHLGKALQQGEHLCLLSR